MARIIRVSKKITRLCIRDPIQRKASPDWSKEFFLETDLSSFAVGGVCYQYDDKQNTRPIMWMGRKLNKNEANYCTRDQELLAVLYCIERARMYLYGRHFTVKTDHFNLLWLYENDVQGRIARWATKLSAYDFTIKHIRGKDNIVADGISRMRGATAVVMSLTTDNREAMRTTCDKLTKRNRTGIPHETKQDIRSHMELTEWEHEKRYDFITQKRMNANETSNEEDKSNLQAIVFHLKIGEKQIASWEALKDHTREDLEMSDLYQHLQNPLKHPLQKEETKNKKKSFELDIQQGILLYKKNGNKKTIENDDFWRIYVPSTMRRTAMALVHCMPTGAHMGRDRMKKLMKETFFWKG